MGPRWSHAPAVRQAPRSRAPSSRSVACWRRRRFRERSRPLWRRWGRQVRQRARGVPRDGSARRPRPRRQHRAGGLGNGTRLPEERAVGALAAGSWQSAPATGCEPWRPSRPRAPPTRPTRPRSGPSLRSSRSTWSERSTPSPTSWATDHARPSPHRAVTRGEGVLPEPTRTDLLERAHRAAPTLPSHPSSPSGSCDVPARSIRSCSGSGSVAWRRRTPSRPRSTACARHSSSPIGPLAGRRETARGSPRATCRRGAARAVRTHGQRARR